MKIIFLDIDGVLNSFDNMRAMTLLSNERVGSSRDEFGHLFDERCVRWLKYILKKTEAGIVISSTWRSMGLGKIQTMWKLRNLVGEIKDITPTEVDLKIINLYAASNNEADRGYEIQQWIDLHKPEKYCIIDDDSDMLWHQKKFFVQTKGTLGLTMTDADKVIAILNAENYKNE